MNRNFQQSNTKGKITPRHVVTALGILLITFGVFAWQWRAFNERNKEEIAEIEPILEPPQNTHWHEATSEVRLAVASKIRGQLTALSQKNYKDALQYHTFAVREAYPEADDFQRAIEADYPQLPGHKKLGFRFVNTDKKQQFANAGIYITAPNGALFETVYQLSFEEERWAVRGMTRPIRAAKSSK